MNALSPNSETDTRRGLDRWENEGGRIRSGTEISNRLSQSARNFSKNAGEAGLGSWSDAVPISWSGPRKKEES